MSTITHEFGHCMGLPDYYSYTAANGDWQATTGEAGIERMDEAEGDFCPGSKLLLGWYTEEQVQTYDLEGDTEQTFTLSDDSTTGSCLILLKDNSDHCVVAQFPYGNILTGQRRKEVSVYPYLAKNTGGTGYIGHDQTAHEDHFVYERKRGLS